MTGKAQQRRHVSFRLPEDLMVRVEALGASLRARRPAWVPPTCRLNETEVVAIALERGIAVLEQETKKEGRAP